MNNLARLRRFIGDMTSLVGGAWQDKDEAATVEVGAKLLGELVAHDDWLPESMAKCPPHGYAQNMARRPRRLLRAMPRRARSPLGRARP
jgi:predicted metal-dependent enzyme (double-stranded beta helix superfamily)